MPTDIQFLYLESKADCPSSEEEEDEKTARPEHIALIAQLKEQIEKNIESAKFPEGMDQVLDQLKENPDLSALPLKKLLREKIATLKRRKGTLARAPEFLVYLSGMTVEEVVTKNLEPNMLLRKTTIQLIAAESHLRHIQLQEQSKKRNLKKEYLIHDFYPSTVPSSNKETTP